MDNTTQGRIGRDDPALSRTRVLSLGIMLALGIRPPRRHKHRKFGDGLFGEGIFG